MLKLCDRIAESEEVQSALKQQRFEIAATINSVQPLYTHPYYGVDFTVTGKV